MIEIKYEEREKVDKLYEEIKELIMSNEDNETFNYNKHQHVLYEESKYPGISKKFYNETGSVEFKNTNGIDVFIEIRRFHPHQHNGCSGLNGMPCKTAKISIDNNGVKEIIWQLEITSGTMYYKAKVTSLEIPYDILKQEKINKLLKK